MGEKTKIAWTDSTWNPVWGCCHSCEYCYARGTAKRYAGEIAKKEVKYADEARERGRMNIPVPCLDALTDRLAEFKPTWIQTHFDRFKFGKPKRVFVGSMTDVFFWTPEWVNTVIDKIKEYPQHTFQFLTKNPSVYGMYKFPENCWLGTTVTTPEDAKRRIPPLVRYTYPDNIAYISMEPLLEQTSIIEHLQQFQETENGPVKSWGGISWVIVGGMSGKSPAPMPVEWACQIRDECRIAGVPFFMKQMSGGHAVPVPDYLQIQEFPDV